MCPSKGAICHFAHEKSPGESPGEEAQPECEGHPLPPGKAPFAIPSATVGIMAQHRRRRHHHDAAPGDNPPVARESSRDKYGVLRRSFWVLRPCPRPLAAVWLECARVVDRRFTAVRHAEPYTKKGVSSDCQTPEDRLKDMSKALLLALC